MKTLRMTYSVIVRNPNSWNAATGIHEELANCGHKHRTVQAGAACLANLAKPYEDGGIPATWYNARLEENETGEYPSDDTVQAPKRTREEAAEMVLRSMVADMRRQGWSLSNESADQMVAKLSAEILALPGIGETR
jgi:uncharacterized membrane protein YebE (DUF533 family)